MTLEELKNGMREYFKKYKSQMTSKERKEFTVIAVSNL